MGIIGEIGTTKLATAGIEAAVRRHDIHDDQRAQIIVEEMKKQTALLEQIFKAVDHVARNTGVRGGA